MKRRRPLAPGEVYRARDTKLTGDVALKVLPETFIDDRDRVRRTGDEPTGSIGMKS